MMPNPVSSIVCTFYSHEIGFDRITDILQKVYPKEVLTVTGEDGSQIVHMEIKGGLFSSTKKLKITYRQRLIPSYQLTEDDGGSLITNLKGLYGFVNSLPSRSEKVKSLLLHKILTLNAEFSIIQEQGEARELKTLIQTLAKDFDAILFVQPNTIISKAAGQHFLDNNLNLILDRHGNCDVEMLHVRINSSYFDKANSEITDDQKERKAKNEEIIKERKIKIIEHLPPVASEKETTIRSAQEIAQRVAVLSVINAVAFNSIPNDKANAYLQQYNLWHFVTNNEQGFLANPTEERKIHETWKCEGIWTLMWALKKVDGLGSPDTLCDLRNIAFEDYPTGADKNPNDFIKAIADTRTKSEILDANDLYYRLNWACVNARIHNKPITEVHASLAHERHYTLNWLINYRRQEWDDVSCDT